MQTTLAASLPESRVTFAPVTSLDLKENAAMPSQKLPALLSVPRAAELLGLKRASAYRYAANGELPTQRFGGRVYVITAQIRHLIGNDVEAAA